MLWFPLQLQLLPALPLRFGLSHHLLILCLLPLVLPHLHQLVSNPTLEIVAFMSTAVHSSLSTSSCTGFRSSSSSCSRSSFRSCSRCSCCSCLCLGRSLILLSISLRSYQIVFLENKRADGLVPVQLLLQQPLLLVLLLELELHLLLSLQLLMLRFPLLLPLLPALPLQFLLLLPLQLASNPALNIAVFMSDDIIVQ